jgi:hypothetical protein
MADAAVSALAESEQELLRRAVSEQRPELLPLLSEIGRRPLTTEEREALRGALSEELAATGLGEDGEPTGDGRRLDDLIGRLGAF